MVQFLSLRKWTLFQISQLACFCDNNETSSKHSPNHLPLSPFSLLSTLLSIPTLQTPQPRLSHSPFTPSPLHITFVKLSPAATWLNSFAFWQPRLTYRLISQHERTWIWSMERKHWDNTACQKQTKSEGNIWAPTDIVPIRVGEEQMERQKHREVRRAMKGTRQNNTWSWGEMKMYVPC